MAWLEVSCEVAIQETDHYSDLLESLGAVSISLYDAGNQPILEPAPGTTPLWDKLKIVGLFPADCNVDLLHQQLTAFLAVPYQLTPLAEQEWTRTWLEHFQPMRFGQKLWIVPEQTPLPSEVTADAAIVRLDPGLAFGTGTHPTTALCLRWLDANPPRNKTVIDYGCGSGILGIAALKLGAQEVFAIDYDPQALTATQENAKRNDIDPTRLKTFAPEHFKAGAAQVVLANILAEPLISLAPTLKDCCLSGGSIVMSGFLDTQLEKLKATYAPWFRFRKALFEEEWGLLEAIRS